MDESKKQPRAARSGLPDGEEFKRVIAARHWWGRLWRMLLVSSLLVALLALGLLLFTVVDEAMGMVAVQSQADPSLLEGRPLEALSKDELITVLESGISRGTFRRLDREKPFEQRTPEEMLALTQELMRETVVQSWPLHTALLNRSAIEAQLAETHPEARLEFRSWLTWRFLTSPMSSEAEIAGVRTALMGTLWMILITMAVALPIGIGASIYLEEYATDNWFNRIIQTNINNLAGVPSIIYGMLGLAVFVRALAPLTSGALFGVNDANGRTILAAGLTMALLILPIIIINSQEALRAVPRSLRLASYGLGATKWQTIWHHVLPGALPGILTGSILAVSRALGETAPLIVIGASTYIVADPDGPFSKFTSLTIQIYNWTSRPQDIFRDVAAAAIVVLLILLLSLNSIAVLLRNRFSRRYS